MGARSLADVHNALAAAEWSQGHAIAFAFFAERRVDAADPSPPLPAPPDPLHVHRTIGEQRGRHMYRAGRQQCPPLQQQRHSFGRRRVLSRTRPAEPDAASQRSEEHTSELQSLMRISYAVFCLKKKK